MPVHHSAAANALIKYINGSSAVVGAANQPKGTSLLDWALCVANMTKMPLICNEATCNAIV